LAARALLTRVAPNLRTACVLTFQNGLPIKTLVGALVLLWDLSDTHETVDIVIGDAA
jgi:hypothetical protein